MYLLQLKSLKMYFLKNFLIIAFLLSVSFSLFANGDYLVIVAEGGDTRVEVSISKNGGQYEKIILKDKGTFNWSGTLDKVKQYENKGYNLLSTNTTGNRITFVMRKKQD